LKIQIVANLPGRYTRGIEEFQDLFPPANSKMGVPENSEKRLDRLLFVMCRSKKKQFVR
jgi:hypothetical protein